MLTISLFGSFLLASSTACTTVQPLTKLESIRGRALLAYLVVETADAHPRERLATLLWPDHAPTKAGQNLRRTLYNLRQTLMSDQELLVITKQSVQLNRTYPHQLDLNVFMNHLHDVRCHDHPLLAHCTVCRQRLETAATLYRGPFLQDLHLPDNEHFETWRAAWQHYLQQQYLILLTQLAEIYEGTAHISATIHIYQKLLTVEPWDEAIHRKLMRLLVRSGQRATAITHYERLRLLLRQEVGTELEATTIALAEQIRASTPPSRANGTHEQSPASGHDGELAIALELPSLINHETTVPSSLVEYGQAVTELRFHPSGNTLVSVSGDGVLIEWSVADGAILRQWSVPDVKITALALNREGELLLLGTANGHILQWGWFDGTIRQHITAHAQAVRDLVYHPTKPILISASDEGEIAVWDVETGECKRRIAAHDGAILSLTLSPNGTKLLSGGTDHTVKLWDWMTGTLLLQQHRQLRRS